MKNGKILPAILILISVAVAFIFVMVAHERPFSQLEGVFLQAFILIAGITGSYFFRRQAARKAAYEAIKPHARPAFRRLLSLFDSLSRLANAIEKARLSNIKTAKDNTVLDKLSAIVIEQIHSADDALEDWADIIPDDVDEIRKRLGGIAKREVKR